jgi:Holliday junction DNA helicase RuvA
MSPMIGRLRGQLVDVEAAIAVIDAAGVGGYEVSLPDLVLAQLPEPGAEVTLLIRQIFREDGVSLYGFALPFQRRLFDLLLGVKGCGPKVGLALIGQLGEDAVASAIIAGDSRTLSRATGVGARLAERIILELKDKIREEALLRKSEAGQPSAKSKPTATDELIEALMALGYRKSEADGVAAEARQAEPQLQDQLKHALRLLGK